MICIRHNMDLKGALHCEKCLEEDAMSNDWINVRLFYWHFKIGPDYRFYFRLAFNKYHVGRGSPWFERYTP
jgi:hypothetical protein